MDCRQGSLGTGCRWVKILADDQRAATCWAHAVGVTKASHSLFHFMELMYEERKRSCNLPILLGSKMDGGFITGR